MISQRTVVATMQQAAAKLAADEDRTRRLGVFVDYWTLDAYTPPPDVVQDVIQIVIAFLALARSTPPEESQ